jgi:hypothetical protein
VITAAFLLLALGAGVPSQLSGFSTLQSSPVWVGCTTAEGSSWCRSVATVAAPVDRLEGILRDFAHYPQVFLRVKRATVVDANVVRILLDMPSPLSDRDYVARFTRSTDGSDVVFRWAAVEHPSAPEVPEAVRLKRAAGEWRLTPQDDGSTRVTYTWNGEMDGDFPAWALSRAHQTQGNEVLVWLQQKVQ